jgi:hypothetical protein
MSRIVAPAIQWRLHLPVAPERVYAALDGREGRESFWAERAPEVGEYIEFSFINGDTYRSRLLRRTSPTLWEINYFGGPATFTLSQDGHGGTDLLLTHRGVKPTDWTATYAGWLSVLLPLKAWLVYGVDLRNHDRRRTWNDGYVDQ